LQVEYAAKTADLGIGTDAAGGADQRLDCLDQSVAGVDIDPRVAVSQSLFGVGHQPLRCGPGLTPAATAIQRVSAPQPVSFPEGFLKGSGGGLAQGPRRRRGTPR